MQIEQVIAQLRTTDLSESIRFYSEKLGFTVEFQYEDFYAGIRAGNQVFHLEPVDVKEARSISSTRALYFGESRTNSAT